MSDEQLKVDVARRALELCVDRIDRDAPHDPAKAIQAPLPSRSRFVDRCSGSSVQHDLSAACYAVPRGRRRQQQINALPAVKT